MRVCVVGAGAREHALAHVLARTSSVVVTPGSDAMRSAAIEVSAAPAESIDAELYVIGPEVPLVDGLADRLRAKGARVFGPSAEGARLEGSKAFMKSLAAAAGVPTARFVVADEPSRAERFFATTTPPYVVKTDGLAAGKGVLVTNDLAAALADVESKLAGASFGEAGRTVVLEEGLVGPELSLLVLCDGNRLRPLPPARDYKRVFDGDRGPNTGGMGAYSSDDLVEQSVVDAIMTTIVEPTLAELKRRSIDYRGVLYAGCMLTDEGPKLIEYNVRFGDPEAEVVLPRLDEDVAELLWSVADGSLAHDVRVVADAAVCVVLAAAGYPQAPRAGDKISGLEAASSEEAVTIFHGGTRLSSEGCFETTGGRVLTISALGHDRSEARGRVYAAIEQVNFAGMQFRHDIALAGEHNKNVHAALPTGPPIGAAS